MLRMIAGNPCIVRVLCSHWFALLSAVSRSSADQMRTGSLHSTAVPTCTGRTWRSPWQGDRDLTVGRLTNSPQPANPLTRGNTLRQTPTYIGNGTSSTIGGGNDHRAMAAVTPSDEPAAGGG